MGSQRLSTDLLRVWTAQSHFPLSKRWTHHLFLNWRKPETGEVDFPFVQILSPLMHVVGGRNSGQNICEQKTAIALWPTVGYSRNHDPLPGVLTPWPPNQSHTNGRFNSFYYLAFWVRARYGQVTRRIMQRQMTKAIKESKF